MGETPDPDEVLEAARQSVDQAQLQEILQEISGNEVDEQTVQALQEVAAEEIALAAIRAANRARRRGRSIEADDVAAATEECEDSKTVGDRPELLFARWESH